MNDALRRAKRRIRRSGKGKAAVSTGNNLTITIITVLLTFFLTTVGGGLLNFWTRLNENATAAAQVEMQNGLEAYNRYLKDIVPDLKRAQDIGIEIIKQGEERPGTNIRDYALKRTLELPDMSAYSDDGPINLYLGRDAGIGLHALGGQYLAMRVMIERNAASGRFPASSQQVSEYLTALRINYSVYLVEILKCKQRVAKSFMLFGKLEAMEKCEKPSARHLETWDFDIWGPGIFEKNVGSR